MSEVNAAGRVFGVRGSSFLEKMRGGGPKKRLLSKKKLFIAMKKKGTRAPCNYSTCVSKVSAAGRVFGVRGSSFLAKMRVGGPKKRQFSVSLIIDILHIRAHVNFSLYFIYLQE